MPRKYLVAAVATLAIAVSAGSLVNRGSPLDTAADTGEGGGSSGPEAASDTATRSTPSNPPTAPPTTAPPTTTPPTPPVDSSAWLDVASGSGRQPTITIDDSIYPNGVGVQFLLNGAVDERHSARPNGYDATGPQEGSTFHVYPSISLSPGDVIEARWVDRSSVARSSQVTIDGSGQPAPDPDPDSDSPPPPPPPAIAGFPSATNVGFLGDPATLTPSGGLTITTNGTVIQGRDISGTIKIRANNVTIRGNRIRTGGDYWIDIGNGTSGHLIEDNSLIGPAIASNATGDHGMYLRPGSGGSPINVTIRRNVILRAQLGIGGHARNTVIEENYIGDNWHAPGSHGTASSLDGADNVTYRRNTFSMPNSGVSSDTALYGRSPIKNITYDSNLFRGGPNLTFAINGGYGTPKPYDPTNVKIINNVFERATVPTPLSRTGPSYVITGNVWDDGTPI